MNALVVLENHFYKDENNKIWCDRVVDYNFLKRYLNVFEKITLCGRTQKIKSSEVKNKLLVNGENVSFISIPEFKGAMGLLKNLIKIRKIISKALDAVDCAIYRAPTHLSLFTYKEVLKKKKTLALEFMMAADKMFEGSSFIKIVLNKIIVRKTQKMCMKANGVSYVTERKLQEMYPCKAIIDGESMDYFTASYSTIDLPIELYNKKKWNISEKPDCFNIIHTGYMDSYRKGQDVLIKAIKLVRNRGYNVKLILIGDGQKRSEFENLAKECGIEESVLFKGLIKSQKEILKNLQTAHMLVFPTQSEGLPRTIIEAMSQGLPCIASPVDGIPELLSEKYLVDYTDIEGYAQKIIYFLDNWDKMIECSNENYKNSLKYEKMNLQEIRNQYYKKIKENASNEKK